MTAAKAGIAGVRRGLLVTLFMWPMETMPHNLMITTTVVGLVSWTLAAVIGASSTQRVRRRRGMGAGMGARM